MSVQIHPSWKKVLKEEFQKPYFIEIKKRLLEKRAKGEIIYPPGPLIFNAFNLTPFDTIKVVILGQDPYHGPGQAHGLAFSVPDGVALPPSLQNIFKEIFKSMKSDEGVEEVRGKPPILLSKNTLTQIHSFRGEELSLGEGSEIDPKFRSQLGRSEYGIEKKASSLGNVDKRDSKLRFPSSGNLEYLAKQGVLLLNAILTVSANKPASHHDIGWQQFTDAVIKKISDLETGIIFLLRGNFARQKKSLIDTTKHIVLETTHPSPLSANKGFLGSGCFRETNEFLLMQRKSPIQRMCCK